MTVNARVLLNKEARLVPSEKAMLLDGVVVTFNDHQNIESDIG